MKPKETFQSLRKQKIHFSLHFRLTFVIVFAVSISLFLSFAISSLLKHSFPGLRTIPIFIQLIVLSCLVASLVAWFFSKMFSDPVQQLREGMRSVADGNFDIQLECQSSTGEMKELFAGFNMMVRELQSTEILQTDFVSNVSHEFKTPINAIEGYAMLLQNTEHMDTVEYEYIEKILYNTQRLSTLVSNILLLSKIENQSIQTHQESYRMDEQIREAILSLELAWEEKTIDFDVELDEVEYYGSKHLLYHVWTNLMSNAIKFSPQGGLITLRLCADDNWIRFWIDDQDPGLSETAGTHIFDKFYQEDTSHKSEGNGLGLALVKGIVAMSEGEVFAENLPNGGCRFTVLLKPNISPNTDVQNQKTMHGGGNT